MLFQKFIEISKIGRFKSMNAEGDVTFAQTTLIYGDNGSGKTTICALFRSLNEGSADYIGERETLGVNGTSPVVKVLLEGGTESFQNGKWSSSRPIFEIFDDVFVTENVYAGNVVANEHRKNLYDVIVGPAAVKLAKHIDSLDATGRSIAGRIRTIEQAIREKIQAPFDLAEFITLEPIPDVAQQISSLTQELSAARNADKIVSRPQLSKVEIPDSPGGLLELLKTGVEAIAADAQRRVRSHLEGIGSDGERWLKQGFDFVHDEDCPFCAQSLATSPVYDSFHLYFSDAYDELVIRLQQRVDSIEGDFSEERFSRIQQVSHSNEGSIQNWQESIDLNFAKVSASDYEVTWRNLRRRAIALFSEKISNPTKVQFDTASLEAALRAYDELRKLNLSSNESIERANSQISEMKKKAASANPALLEADLRKLRNSQIRQENDVDDQCSKLVEERELKAQFENEKTQAKADLETQSTKLLAEYESDMNSILSSFGASFKLAGTRPTFAGGKASSTYDVSVNNVPVNVSNSNIPAGKPSFKSVLSSGDKSTLALAFFLARLEREDLSQKVVVLDDPLTSLDTFRQRATQQRIAGLAAKAGQVVVLCHEPFFLKGIKEQSSVQDSKSLHLVRRGNSQSIAQWDISEYCTDTAHRDYFILKSFLDEGLPDDRDVLVVARAIRPYLESQLRYRFPRKFSDAAQMGEIISKIRGCEPSDELALLKPRLDELSEINDYCRDYHHGNENPTSIPNEQEVKTYAERAISVIQN